VNNPKAFMRYFMKKTISRSLLISMVIFGITIIASCKNSQYPVGQYPMGTQYYGQNQYQRDQLQYQYGLLNTKENNALIKEENKLLIKKFNSKN
jgi:hypothetical protein